ncbi:hypothetical protein E2C01_043253 [Portunus trituberculatus]|uniref:Uncharacterized protein n=1 Tax=Portunus trituberculatus TaxID=210409 RepID=A0A5B7FPS9_PORTR|nr:hypothetical protein [Portunus trituberculatus]
MRIEKVGGNREGVTLSCLRQLCFGEEKMSFSRGEVVFYRLKIRSKTANVIEVNEEKSRKVSKHFRSPPREQSDLGIFLVPSPEGDSEAGFGVAILNSEFQAYLKSICGKRCSASAHLVAQAILFKVVPILGPISPPGRIFAWCNHLECGYQGDM